ncbi:glycosyltransferase [Mycobacterium sp. PSTR-4-N]|uniref:glycosyltransferase n=1 Tax=Mycobacterium sp. PSTR-4-N TaxID=2917745 RepID=UPI001F153CF1|nr:glycosyltransferase [Mycobacterium sp. PSTR-4-N]MCG7596291.1 glycosyltransferase [Mycobacterium sp. PSTR-4-N]
MSRPLVAYVVSRFPVTSETFIVRELDAIARTNRYELQIRSLFPAPDSAVHDIARRWVQQLVRPSTRAALIGLGWAVATRPLRVASVVATVIVGYSARPPLLLRALTTVLLACAHARDLAAQRRVVHVHAHYATYPALAAWVCHRLVGATYGFTVHAHDLYVDTSMLDRKIADARYVVTISRFNRDLLQQHNAGGTPIHVIHAGIDTAAYPFRARGIPADGPVRALTVASLQQYKGHAVLLQAMARGGGAVERMTLDLIGDGVLRAELEALAESLGLQRRVRFLGGCSEDQVRAALAAADLFVLPSIVADDGQMEGLPVALMEALASGVPTISTALSGIPEIVVDGATGMLAAPGDVGDLNATLTAMIESGPGAIAFTEAGRALVTGEFDLQSTVAALTGVLDENVAIAPR